MRIRLIIWPTSRGNKASLNRPPPCIWKLWKCFLSLQRLIPIWPPFCNNKENSMKHWCTTRKLSGNFCIHFLHRTKNTFFGVLARLSNLHIWSIFWVLLKVTPKVQFLSKNSILTKRYFLELFEFLCLNWNTFMNISSLISSLSTEARMLLLSKLQRCYLIYFWVIQFVTLFEKSSFCPKTQFWEKLILALLKKM